MSKQEEVSSLTFHYLKSNLFRVIHVDGAIGGMTPRGLIHMTIYSERAAIPKKVSQVIHSDGRIGDEIGREGLEGVVREMEADLIFRLEDAVSLRDWLDDQINNVKKITANKQKET
jgi:hypothetical protein